MLKSSIRGKSAQDSASGAATFLGVIGFVILIYIFLLPAGEKAVLLGDSPSGAHAYPNQGYVEGYPQGAQGNYPGPYGGNGAPRLRALLFSTDAVQVNHLEDLEVEHQINAFRLRTTSEAAVVKEFSSARIEGNLFSADSFEQSFFVDPANTNNLLLSFNAPESSGRLIVYVNGIVVHDSVIRKVSVDPIRIDREYLIAGENTIRFVAPAHGIVFWSRNYFKLSNILLSAIVDDKTLSRYEQSFTVSDSEYVNLEKTKLSFLLNCQSQTVSPLQVQINRELVYSTIPLDCGRVVSFEVDPQIIKQGSNVITFSSLGSLYFVEQAYVINSLAKAPETLFYFTIPQDVFEAIYASGSDAYVRMQFTDDLRLKRGVLFVNGFAQTFETDLKELELPVSTQIIDGTNSLKIEPLDRPIAIQKLEVFTR